MRTQQVDGGFKHVLQKMPLGEMIQLDHFVETGLKPQPK